MVPRWLQLFQATDSHTMDNNGKENVHNGWPFITVRLHPEASKQMFLIFIGQNYKMFVVIKWNYQNWIILIKFYFLSLG